MGEKFAKGFDRRIIKAVDLARAEFEQTISKTVTAEMVRMQMVMTNLYEKIIDLKEEISEGNMPLNYMYNHMVTRADFKEKLEQLEAICFVALRHSPEENGEAGKH